MSWQLERTLDRLDARLCEETDEEERKAIREEMREIGRELADRQRWEDDGRDRGWV